ETIGRFRRRRLVRRVARETSLGRTAECAGTSETSSYVSASAWMRSIGSPGIGGEARHYTAPRGPGWACPGADFEPPAAPAAAAGPAPSPHFHRAAATMGCAGPPRGTGPLRSVRLAQAAELARQQPDR